MSENTVNVEQALADAITETPETESTPKRMTIHKPGSMPTDAVIAKSGVALTKTLAREVFPVEIRHETGETEWIQFQTLTPGEEAYIFDTFFRRLGSPIDQEQTEDQIKERAEKRFQGMVQAVLMAVLPPTTLTDTDVRQWDMEYLETIYALVTRQQGGPNNIDLFPTNNR